MLPRKREHNPWELQHQSDNKLHVSAQRIISPLTDQHTCLFEHSVYDIVHLQMKMCSFTHPHVVPTTVQSDRFCRALKQTNTVGR